VKDFVARCWLALWRWKVVAPPAPLPDKFVLVGAPHTTNWDFPLMLAITRRLGVKVHFLGKDSLFRGPMGPLMRRLGGIPIDRSAPGGMVASLAAEFASRDKLVLLVPAEGTRSHTGHWKSGFYHIARQAGVPVGCGFLDSTTRSGGVGPMVELTGDISRDMDAFRAFYEGKTGVRKGKAGPVRLKEESAGEAA